MSTSQTGSFQSPDDGYKEIESSIPDECTEDSVDFNEDGNMEGYVSLNCDEIEDEDIELPPNGIEKVLAVDAHDENERIDKIFHSVAKGKLIRPPIEDSFSSQQLMMLEMLENLQNNADPRVGIVGSMMWWLLHRRNQNEHHRLRRRAFYRKWRRVLFLCTQEKKSDSKIATNIAKNALQKIRNGHFNKSRTLPRLLPVPSKKNDILNKINKMNDKEFQRTFHLSRPCFNFVYEQVKAVKNRKYMTLGMKQFAAAIFKLAHNADYKKIATMFKMRAAHAVQSIKEVFQIISGDLKPRFLKFNVDGKEVLNGCVGVLGSVDIICPETAVKSSSYDYDSKELSSRYSGKPSFAFQAVVNAEGCFTYATPGIPGGMTNEEIVNDSNLKETFKECFNQNGEESKFLIACDNSLPETSWLKSLEFLKDANNYDELLQAVPNVFENALVKMKNRWAIFAGAVNEKPTLDSEERNLVSIACVVLHNICTLKKDTITFAEDDDKLNVDAHQDLFLRTQILNQSSDSYNTLTEESSTAATSCKTVEMEETKSSENIESHHDEETSMNVDNSDEKEETTITADEG